MTSVTVVVPMTIRRRGGRKQIIGPDGALVRASQDSSAVATTSGDPVMVKALARAFRWRRMLEDGRYASIRELAKAEGVDRNYVGRLLNLTLLSPRIVESLLDGKDTAETTHQGLIEAAANQGFGWAVRPTQRSLDRRSNLCASQRGELDTRWKSDG